MGRSVLALFVLQNEDYQMCCRTRKNQQIQQKLPENEENLAVSTVILMSAFGTENVHSAM